MANLAIFAGTRDDVAAEEEERASSPTSSSSSTDTTSGARRPAEEAPARGRPRVLPARGRAARRLREPGAHRAVRPDPPRGGGQRPPGRRDRRRRAARHRGQLPQRPPRRPARSPGPRGALKEALSDDARWGPGRGAGSGEWATYTGTATWRSTSRPRTASSAGREGVRRPRHERRRRDPAAPARAPRPDIDETLVGDREGLRASSRLRDACGSSSASPPAALSAGAREARGVGGPRPEVLVTSVGTEIHTGLTSRDVGWAGTSVMSGGGRPWRAPAGCPDSRSPRRTGAVQGELNVSRAASRGGASRRLRARGLRRGSSTRRGSTWT